MFTQSAINIQKHRTVFAKCTSHSYSVFPLRATHNTMCTLEMTFKDNNQHPSFDVQTKQQDRPAMKNHPVLTRRTLYRKYLDHSPCRMTPVRGLEPLTNHQLLMQTVECRS